MKKYIEQLHDVITEAPSKKIKHKLTILEDRIFRSLRMHGERSTKGLDITKALFEVKRRDDVVFLMILEGRQSVFVGNQMVKKFGNMEGVSSANLIKTKKGACVVIKPKAEQCVN
jgi:hypothetical protein